MKESSWKEIIRKNGNEMKFTSNIKIYLKEIGRKHVEGNRVLGC
jgi:hypothetical protein